jgi:hypothetical protein
LQVTCPTFGTRTRWAWEWEVLSMKATPCARVLVALVDGLDRYWGPVGVMVVVALEAFVFAPRGQTMAMIIGAIVGTALLVAWLIGEA